MAKLNIVLGAPPPELVGDQREIWEFFDKVKLVCVNKNADYGSSVFEPPVLARRMLPSEATLVRMSDKVKRIQNLLKNPDSRNVKDESVDDTIMDLGCYAFLYLMNRQREKEGRTEHV